MSCPRCKGTGTLALAAITVGDRVPPDDAPCDVCGGTGKVPHTWGQDWIKKHVNDLECDECGQKRSIVVYGAAWICAACYPSWSARAALGESRLRLLA